MWQYFEELMIGRVKHGCCRDNKCPSMRKREILSSLVVVITLRLAVIPSPNFRTQILGFFWVLFFVLHSRILWILDLDLEELEKEQCP